MSFFSKILEKLGLSKDKDKDQPAASAHTSAPVAGPPKPAAQLPLQNLLLPPRPQVSDRTT